MGLDRDQADEIVRKAVAKYEEKMSEKPIGKPFDEVYDPITIKPTKEWKDVYDKVREEAGSWGLSFK